MLENLIDLDAHRGSADQLATDIRRERLFEFLTDQEALRLQQKELEIIIMADRADSWPEAAAKAQYLIGLFAATQEAQNPLRKQLIARTLKDLSRLCSREPQRS